ncbi:Panacea domain-containing protein [Bacteroides sp. L008]|uniref:Panacea domain-containing protein n=1 Tax=Bacteroides sp. L008 TaxID=3162404 RepID=UPI0034653F08
MKLTSIDYARLIQYAAQKLHMTRLNKTQINKILFYVYGVYYAETGKLLFDDDSPKAWPYGPVFPIVNKKTNPDEIIKAFPNDVLCEFNKHSKALGLVKSAVDMMHSMSAVSLTQWSHKEGSPWYNTLYIKDKEGKVVEQNKWNTPISTELIKEYFSNPANRIK